MHKNEEGDFNKSSAYKISLINSFAFSEITSTATAKSSDDNTNP